MPLIDKPFKRVADDIVRVTASPSEAGYQLISTVEIVEAIAQLSEAGHRLISTLVNYATRYPEPPPLKTITIKAVADIYSRVGFPEEMLTNHGTWSMFKCMHGSNQTTQHKGSGLSSMPYHPICNGLVERWNGTLISKLRRLCQDNLKQ